MVTLSPEKRQEWFVGAIELAMLDLLRQEYVDNEDVRTLFVIDFPRMAQVHCVPPLHLSTAEATGLLPAPLDERYESINRQGPAEHDLGYIRRLAERFPLTLGLTEVLSRFVFERSWSNDTPKLMLDTQTAEAASIEDAMRSQSLDEWRRSAKSDQIETAKRKFGDLYASSKSIEEFVASVANEAQEYLPALYGEYSQVRRFIRFSDIAPTPDEEYAKRRVAYAHGIKELREYFGEIRAGGVNVVKFETLCKRWEKAIPDVYSIRTPASKLDKLRILRRADAETLATIEYLNGRLVDDKIGCRLVFLSDDQKLFQGALLHFGVIKEWRHLKFNPSRTIGSASAFDRGRYNAHILRSVPGDHLRKVPILDPRALMTGRRFVDYAVGLGAKGNDVDSARAITEWLPVFFDGLERNKTAVASTYLALQKELHARGSDIMDATRFQASQYAALQSSWGRYIKTVGTAHGLTRYSTRAHLRDILVDVVQNKGEGVQVAIRKQLDQVMSEWLPAVGGATLAHRLSTRSADKPVGRRSRAVPPLVIPVIAAVQESLTALLGGIDIPSQRPLSERLAWITKPTVENFGLDGSWNNTPWKLNYLQALGLAYGFALEGNWSAAYRLSSSAISLAQINRDSSGKPDESFISGREAAFLASIAARRSLATRPVFLQSLDIERNLINQFQEAIELERPLFEENEWGKRLEAQFLRLRSEKLAWETYRLLCSVMRAQRGSDVDPFPGRSRLEAATLEAVGEVNRLRKNFAQNADTRDITEDAYLLALNFEGRQLLFSVLQIEVFGILSNTIPTDANSQSRLKNLLIRLADFSPLKTKVANCELKWSGLEQEVISKAIDLAKNVSARTRALLNVTTDPSENLVEATTIPQEFSLAEWRLNMLRSKVRAR